MEFVDIDSRYIDIVMCIDATAGMSPFISELQENATSFFRKIISDMEDDDKKVASLRIKVITFRDYRADEDPLNESQFFAFPEETLEFMNFINSIEAKGGGGRPKNALEAIALALKSDWITEGTRQFHIIMVFSDAPAHILGECADAPNYPVWMPKDFAQLSAWWEGRIPIPNSSYKFRAGRLFTVVPNTEPWTKFHMWDRSWQHFVPEGSGLSEICLTNL